MQKRKYDGSQTKRQQYLAGVAACLSLVTSGAWFTWPAPLLSRLLSLDSPVPMTTEQASWMVSFIEVGSLLGCYPAFLIADHLGRKFCILICAPAYLITFALTVYVKNFWALCVARLIAGIAMGMTYSILPCYLGEIASPEVRGTVTSMFHIAWGIGCLIPYCIGPYLSYELFTYFTFGITVVFFLSFVWQPESPYYYAMKGETKLAKEMLQRLRDRASSDAIEIELKEVQEEVEEALEKKVSLKDVVATEEDRRALLLIIIVGVISFLSGQNAILTYTTDTFSQFPSSFLSPDNVTVGIGFAAFVGSLTSIFTSDKFGRRFLLLFSASGCMVSLFIASAYFYVVSNTNIEASQYSWVAAVALMGYNFFVTAGMHPVCVTYSSELFPTKTRGLASTISNLNLTFCSFLVLKFYETLATNAGVYFPYLVFGLTCLVGIIFFYYMMPETNGKTFLEIREMLSKKRESNDEFTPLIKR